MLEGLISDAWEHADGAARALSNAHQAEQRRDDDELRCLLERARSEAVGILDTIATIQLNKRGRELREGIRREREAAT